MDGKKQEKEVTEEPKRFTVQETARGFSLSEEALLVCEAQDPDVEWYLKVAAAVQNVIECYCVICDEKGASLDHFFKRADRTDSSKQQEPVPSRSGVSEIAAHWPCPPLCLSLVVGIALYSHCENSEWNIRISAEIFRSWQNACHS